MEFLDKNRAEELWERVECILKRKQDKLTGLTGQVVGFDESGEAIGYTLPLPNNVATLGMDGILNEIQRPSLAQIIGGSNFNLLDNWYFANPINQRKKEIYTSTGYSVDRWVCDGAVAVSSGYVETASNLYQRAPLELTEYLLGKVLTLSVLYQNGVLEFGTVTVPNSIPTSSGQSESATECLSIYLYTNGVMQLFRLNKGHKIFAVKAELGEEQTLARQNESGEWELIDPPPERGLELLKCQRYQVVYGGEGGMPLLAPGYSTGAVTAVFLLDLPTAMRATPAVSFSNLYVNLSGTRIPVTGAAVLGAPAQNKLAMQVTCSGANFGAGEPCFLEGQGDYRLLLDANL